MINEAIYTLYEGVGCVEAIDTAMRLGANHPMGPLQLADFIGLDTCLSVMQVLHEGLADSKYRPCPLLVKYVEAGWLGRKTQRGFYDYRGEPRCRRARASARFAIPVSRRRRQIGPALPSDPQRLLAPPFRDRLVIAREQHLGDGAALPFARPGVMRIFEQAGLETLGNAGFRLAHHAGDQPHAGVEHGERGDFAARKDVIADDTSIRVRASTTRSSTPSKRAQITTRPGPAAHSRAIFCVNGSPRGLINSRGRDVRRERGLEARRQHVRPHHHAGAAARRRIVDGTMAPKPMLANVAPSRDHKPRSSASPASDRPSGPGNISGDRVKIVAANIGSFQRVCRTNCCGTDGFVLFDFPDAAVLNRDWRFGRYRRVAVIPQSIRHCAHAQRRGARHGGLRGRDLIPSPRDNAPTVSLARHRRRALAGERPLGDAAAWLPASRSPGAERRVPN